MRLKYAFCTSTAYSNATSALLEMHVSSSLGINTVVMSTAFKSDRADIHLTHRHAPSWGIRIKILSAKLIYCIKLGQKSRTAELYQHL
jgi:hypothetical protein